MLYVRKVKMTSKGKNQSERKEKERRGMLSF